MANTEPYPTRWDTIHFGMNADDLSSEAFIFFRATNQSESVLIFIDGDGWQQWSALPGTGDNDTTSMHVQIATQTKAGMADVITSLRNSGLPFVPYARTDEHGNLVPLSIIVTQAQDWHEEVYTERFN